MWKIINLFLVASASTACFATVTTGVLALDVEQSDVAVTAPVPTEKRIDNTQQYNPRPYIIHHKNINSQLNLQFILTYIP